MANRNKKKGFMKEMKEIRGSKTVFDREASDSLTSLPEGLEKARGTYGHNDQLGNTDMGLHTDPEAHLPPSERESLPGNVFVTSKEYRRPVKNNTLCDDRPNGGKTKNNEEVIIKVEVKGKLGELKEGMGYEKEMDVVKNDERALKAEKSKVKDEKAGPKEEKLGLKEGKADAEGEGQEDEEDEEGDRGPVITDEPLVWEHIAREFDTYPFLTHDHIDDVGGGDIIAWKVSLTSSKVSQSFNLDYATNSV